MDDLDEVDDFVQDRLPTLLEYSIQLYSNDISTESRYLLVRSFVELCNDWKDCIDRQPGRLSQQLAAVFLGVICPHLNGLQHWKQGKLRDLYLRLIWHSHALIFQLRNEFLRFTDIHLQSCEYLGDTAYLLMTCTTRQQHEDWQKMAIHWYSSVIDCKSTHGLSYWKLARTMPAGLERLAIACQAMTASEPYTYAQEIILSDSYVASSDPTELMLLRLHRQCHMNDNERTLEDICNQTLDNIDLSFYRRNGALLAYTTMSALLQYGHPWNLLAMLFRRKRGLEPLCHYRKAVLPPACIIEFHEQTFVKALDLATESPQDVLSFILVNLVWMHGLLALAEAPDLCDELYGIDVVLDSVPWANLAVFLNGTVQSLALDGPTPTRDPTWDALAEDKLFRGSYLGLAFSNKPFMDIEAPIHLKLRVLAMARAISKCPSARLCEIEDVFNFRCSI